MVFVAIDSPRRDARPFFQVLTFRDGQIILIKDYENRRKALRAAGLS
jgi:hypothetical protein